MNSWRFRARTTRMQQTIRTHSTTRIYSNSSSSRTTQRLPQRVHHHRPPDTPRPTWTASSTRQTSTHPLIIQQQPLHLVTVVVLPCTAPRGPGSGRGLPRCGPVEPSGTARPPTTWPGGFPRLLMGPASPSGRHRRLVATHSSCSQYLCSVLWHAARVF